MVETGLLRQLFFPVMSAAYIFSMAGAQVGNAESGPYVATRYRLGTTRSCRWCCSSMETNLTAKRTSIRADVQGILLELPGRKESFARA
jgi:hypothetical protein